MMTWSCDRNSNPALEIGIGLFQSWFVDMGASSDFASPSQAMGAFFWVKFVQATNETDPEQQDEIDP